MIDNKDIVRMTIVYEDGSMTILVKGKDVARMVDYLKEEKKDVT